MSTTVTTRQSDSFEVIKSAVNKTVDLIRPTFGPAGNKVIISKVLEKMTVDDGVQIARSLEFDDVAENAVLNVIRETAVRTNDRVGDGTTGALIMLQAIINEVAKLGHRDGRKIARELNKGFAEFEKVLRDRKREIKTKEDLKKVARISFDDAKIAEIIADTWFELGKDGVVTLDQSGTMETFAEITDGITIRNGYISPYMVTNPGRMECVIDKPFFLLTDFRLTEATDIMPIMNKMLEAKKNGLVVIAENVEQNALNTLVLNLRHMMNSQTGKMGPLSSCAVVAPNDGDRLVALEDLALMLGAKVFTAAKGDKLEDAQLSDLGRAEKFIAKQNSSIIIGPRGNKADISANIELLRLAALREVNENKKKEIEKRAARFGNKVAVIKVGAATESEQKALRYKVEDAVNAVRSAFRGGVVCGAGLSLSRIETSSAILNEALKAPHKQLKDNMGIEDVRDLGKDEAINAVTGRTGDYMEVGVLDPVDVLVAGVESAVSIASLLVTCSGMILEEQKKPPVVG